jgi:hypothetical protein
MTPTYHSLETALNAPLAKKPAKPKAKKTASKASAPKKAAKAKAEQKTPVAKPEAKKAAKVKAEPKPKRVSLLDAAAARLARTKKPMSCREMIETLAAEGTWASPNGKTPHATLHAAILREIGAKGDQARFIKAEPGHFAAAS